MSCSSFSQTGTLKPTPQQIDGDTMFCFDIIQTRYIAKLISSGEYCERQIEAYETAIIRRDSLILNKDRQIDALKRADANNQQVYNNQQTIESSLHKALNICDKKLSLNKRLVRVGIIVSVILGVAAIAK